MSHPLHPFARVVLRYCRWSLVIAVVAAYGVIALGPSPATPAPVAAPSAETQLALADGYVAAGEAPLAAACTPVDAIAAKSAVVRDVGSIDSYVMPADLAWDQTGLVWAVKWCKERTPR